MPQRERRSRCRSTRNRTKQRGTASLQLMKPICWLSFVFCNALFDALPAAAGDHHPRAARCEGLGHLKADADVAAGDERHLRAEQSRAGSGGRRSQQERSS